jgi:hypothetical protein
MKPLMINIGVINQFSKILVQIQIQLSGIASGLNCCAQLMSPSKTGQPHVSWSSYAAADSES